MSGVHPSAKRQPLVFSFLVFLLLTSAWQAFYCVASTRRDPAGLFFSGDAFPKPPELWGSYQYPDSRGYDGQMYRLLAHDPLNRKGYWDYLDDARFRSRRILIPALSGLLGGGSTRAVDLGYIAITDIVLALGAVCFVRLAGDGIPTALALAIYALIPAVIASADRMVLDGPAVAGFLAALLFFRERRWRPLWVLAALLPLVRETLICVNAGIGLALLVRREYRRAARAALTAAPALAWWWYAGLRTQPSTSMRLLSFPLWPQIERLVQPFARPVSPAVNLLLESLDLLACICLLWAFFWFGKTVLAEFREGGWKDDTLIVLPSAVLAAVSSSHQILAEPYAFMRVDSVLLAWVILRMVRWRPIYAAAYAFIGSMGLAVFRAGPFLRLLGW